MWASVSFSLITSRNVIHVAGPTKNFDKLLDVALKRAKKLKAKSEKVILSMNLKYKDQCCMEFSNEQLSKIVNAGVSFTIDCWK